MSLNQILVAVDGPSASGKSSVVKNVAKRLNFKLIDSGLFYRAVTYVLSKISLNSNRDLKDDLTKIEIEYKNSKMFYKGIDITEDCRSPEIDKLVGEYASIQDVRDFVNSLLRNFMLNSKHSYIVEGRDIGSFVLPNADIKFFITASAEERALRRQKQQTQLSYEETLKIIKDRDFKDKNRSIAPLICVKDAILIENDKLSLDETVDLITEKIEKCIKENKKDQSPL